MSRFMRFNGVGVGGFVVQTAVLAALVRGLHVHYLIASLIAVESAVLHNFFWHQHWTWRDRAHAGPRAIRLLRFHAANGLTSLCGHAIGMPVLVGACGLPPLFANVLIVLLLSMVNYQLGDRVVFCAEERPSFGGRGPG